MTIVQEVVNDQITKPTVFQNRVVAIGHYNYRLHQRKLGDSTISITEKQNQFVEAIDGYCIYIWMDVQYE